MLKKELEHELGRYKKAVQTRDIVIEQLKEEIAGYKEIAEITSAYIVCLLPEDKEVRINKLTINDIISGTKDFDIIVEHTDTENILKKVKKE